MSLPEVASDPVAEYLRLKVAIASRWIRQEMFAWIGRRQLLERRIQGKRNDFTCG